MQIIYRTDDGKEFDNLNAAKSHEEKNKQVIQLMQISPFITEQVAQALIDNKGQVLKTLQKSDMPILDLKSDIFGYKKPPKCLPYNKYELYPGGLYNWD